ncbi:hypothetical protein Q2409_26525, partial [Escherichia coli]|nr:hypothetical protein [Escherichia coli]
VVAVLVVSGGLFGMFHIMPGGALGTMPWRFLRLMAVVRGGGWARFFSPGGVGGLNLKIFSPAGGKKSFFYK